MAIMTFNLDDGATFGGNLYHEVGLRELNSKDVIDAQLSAEQVTIINGKPMAYTSDVRMGIELLRRQIDFVGDFKGPLSIKDLSKFSPRDLTMIQSKASELDALLVDSLDKI